MLGSTVGGVLAAGLLRSAPVATAQPVEVAPGLAISPRAAWAQGLEPTGPIAAEPDVRFLLVHHTAGANDYGPSEVPATLRSIFGFHAAASKGWPDVAYNFFVDRHGGVWEGRAGSLAGPVAGDATGGSQGFAQLCCFVGHHSEAAPTSAATDSMIRLLAWLADRYAIDTSPGATTRFISRGSNRWPAGVDVVTATIAGHRDMSATECPGDLLYPDVRERYQTLVTQVRVPGPTSSTTLEPSTTPTTTAVMPSEPIGEPAPTTVTTARASAGERPRAAGEVDTTQTGDPTTDLRAVSGIGALLAASAGLVWAILRRRQGGPGQP